MTHRIARTPSAREGDRRSLPLARSSLLVMGSVAVTSGFGFVYWFVAARELTKSSVGIGSSTVASVNLSAVVASFGLGIFLIHRLPRAEGLDWLRLVTRAVLASLVLGGAAGLALPGLLWLISSHYHPVVTSPLGILAIFVFVLGQTVSVMTDALSLAERRADVLFGRAVVFAVLKLLLLLPAFGQANAASLIILGWGAAACVSSAASIALVVHHHTGRVRFHLRGPRGSTRIVLGEVSKHWMTTLGGQVPQYSLPVVVLAQGGPGISASFYVGWTIGASVFIVSSAVSQALFAEGRHSDQPLGVLLRRSTLIIGGLMVPGVLATAFVGPLILRWFGKGYASQATTLIRVLAVAAVFDAITNVGVTVARLVGRFDYAAALNVGMAVMAIVVTYLLVPVFGATAGGIGYGMANALGSVVVVVALLRLHGTRSWGPEVAPVAAGAS